MKDQVKLNVVQNDSITIEVLAESIKSISDGINKLKGGSLNEKALILLIQHAAPKIGSKYQKRSLSAREIKAVLSGLESLKEQYLK